MQRQRFLRKKWEVGEDRFSGPVLVWPESLGLTQVMLRNLPQCFTRARLLCLLGKEGDQHREWTGKSWGCSFWQPRDMDVCIDMA